MNRLKVYNPITQQTQWVNLGYLQVMNPGISHNGIIQLLNKEGWVRAGKSQKLNDTEKHMLATADERRKQIAEETRRIVVPPGVRA